MDQNDASSPQGGGKKAVWVVIVLIILALIVWFTMGKKKDDGQKVSSSTQTSNTQNTGSNEQSMKELLASGKSQKCDFNVTTENSSSRGTVYTASGKMSGDFNTTAAGVTQTSHMVSDGTTMYMWADGQSQGVKMSVDSSAQTNSNTPTQNNVDVNTKYDYDCSSWSQDQNKFNIPSSVSFTDMSAMLQGGANASSSNPSAGAGASSAASMKAQQCAACSSLSGEQQVQCKAALSCN